MPLLQDTPQRFEWNHLLDLAEALDTFGDCTDQGRVVGDRRTLLHQDSQHRASHGCESHVVVGNAYSLHSGDNIFYVCDISCTIKHFRVKCLSVTVVVGFTVRTNKQFKTKQGPRQRQFTTKLTQHSSLAGEPTTLSIQTSQTQKQNANGVNQRSPSNLAPYFSCEKNFIPPLTHYMEGDLARYDRFWSPLDYTCITMETPPQDTNEASPLHDMCQPRRPHATSHEFKK